MAASSHSQMICPTLTAKTRKLTPVKSAQGNGTTVLDWLQLRVLSCYNEALMLKEGKMPPPRMAIVYPTYLCNHNCIGCDYTEENKLKKVMTREEFLRVIDQLHDIGVCGMEFCGGGEPTLNPHLSEAIDRAVEHGIHFGMLTNGTNLTKPLQEHLVRFGSYCRISLESAHKKTFDFYKRPAGEQAGFEKVVQNIKELVSLRDQAAPDTQLQISIKYSIDGNNFSDVQQAIKLGRQLNVDSIQFKLIRNMPSEIQDQSAVDLLIERIERAKCNGSSHTHVVYDLSKSKLEGPCWLSPLQVTVDALGDVYICCYYRHRKDAHRLGNLFRKNLRDIWYSQEHWAKIMRINTEDCNKYDCRFHSYNKMMRRLILEDIGQLHFV